MAIDPLTVANIVGQLGPLILARKWPLERPPADRMRGVDFYTATDLVSALVLSAQNFKETHGYLPQLASPTSFNEHIFARKFFAPLPLPSLADKLGVRDFVRARLGEDALTSIVWVGDSVEELFAAKLPAGRFLLKANHGSEMNLILNVPGDLVARRSEIEKTATEWLANRFGYAWGEWQYCTFKPKLFLEGFLNFNGDGTPDDFKFFCFRGKARLIQVHTGRHTRHGCGQYDPSWNHLPVQFGTYEIAQVERPANLGAMIKAAETLAAGLEFARIDLYSDRKSIIKFGEITLTPSNANQRYADFQFDRWLGGFFTQAPGG
jgi:hypothetical protein